MIWWWPCVESSLVLLKECVRYDSAFSCQKSVSLCPALFCTPRSNLPVAAGISWLPTFAFQSPIMKQTSLFGVSSRRSRRSSLNHLTSPSSAFPGGSDDKVSACNAGDLGLIPGLGRSLGEGNSNLLQYPCLENSMDGGAWWASVHGVAKSGTQLSDFTFSLSLSNISWHLSSA